MLLLVLRIRACLVFPMLGSPSLRLLNSMLAFEGIYIGLVRTSGDDRYSRCSLCG